MKSAVMSMPSVDENVTDERIGKYLVFQLAQEEFAIKVLDVREIIRMQDVTKVPHTPVHVKGVINLRGKVLPVIDLRMKFGFPEVEYTQRTCIIVVEVEGDSQSLLVGTIVDGVCEVINLNGADIQDTPDFGQTAASPYLMGIAKSKDKIRILLDIDQVLGHQELQALDSLLPAAQLADLPALLSGASA